MRDGFRHGGYDFTLYVEAELEGASGKLPLKKGTMSSDKQKMGL
jgi:hypothetical protein